MNLRKVKWVIGTKCIIEGKEYNIDDVEVLTLIDDEGKKIDNKYTVYEYGYFHKWTTFYNSDGLDCIRTEEYALVELENGDITYIEPKKIQFQESDISG